jgi:hypothetical protein
MSRDGSIKIITNSLNKSISYRDLLNQFEVFGWKYGVADYIMYLPLGDDDHFNWISVPKLEIEQVLFSVDQKWIRGELMGIEIAWKETDIGVTILTDPEFKELSFSADINRKTIEGIKGSLGITDFSWYIERIVPVLLSLDLSIEVLQCVDG